MYNKNILCYTNKDICGCPMCGKNPVVTSYVEKNIYISDYTKDFPISIRVECPDCGLKLSEPFEI